MDECLPKPLIRSLVGHNFRTAQQMGWGGLKNGKLLEKANDLFHVFVTADQNLRYQQRISGRLLSIIVLPTNHWPTLREKVHQIQVAIDRARPGDYAELEF